MKKGRKEITKEFADRLAFYLKAYGMIDVDLGKAIGASTSDAASIIEGRRGVRFKKAERIANVFGVTYLEMINLEHPLPEVKKLPTYTRVLIEKREIIGIHNPRSGLDLAGNVDEIIYSDYLHLPRTTRDIWLKLPENLREAFSAGRVVSLLRIMPRAKDFDVFPSANKRVLRFALKGKWSEEQDKPLREQLKAELIKEKEIAKAKEKAEKGKIAGKE